MRWYSALALFVVGLESMCFAAPPSSTPEIVTTSASAAIAILIGSGLIASEKLRNRRKG